MVPAMQWGGQLANSGSSSACASTVETTVMRLAGAAAHFFQARQRFNQAAAEYDRPEQRSAFPALSGTRDHIALGLTEHLLGAWQGDLVLAQLNRESVDATDIQLHHLIGGVHV